MPRKARLEVAPAIYHLNARGNRRQPIMLATSDARHFLSILEAVVARYGWLVYSYCLIPNHYHLLLETTSPTLGDGMRKLNGDYAREFNRRYEFGGHLFQGRFHSASVESESHLLELSRYIVLNPVRAGICRRPEDWPWSSYRATVGLASVPAFLRPNRVLRYFGRSLPTARKRYAAFVAESIPAAGAIGQSGRSVASVPRTVLGGLE